MNLWNTIKGWFSAPSTDECCAEPHEHVEAATTEPTMEATPVEVEETPEPEAVAPVATVEAKQPQAAANPAMIGEMFAHMCREAGVKQRYLDSTNAVTLFQEWYTGEANEEDIKAAISEFKKLNPPVNAKFQGKI